MLSDDHLLLVCLGKITYSFYKEHFVFSSPLRVRKVLVELNVHTGDTCDWSCLGLGLALNDGSR